MVERESNSVPFRVLTDNEERQRLGVELSVFRYDDPKKIIDVVPWRINPKFLDELGTGGGSFRVMRADPKLVESPNLLDYRNVCKVYVDRKIVGAFLIQSKPTDYVNREERSGEFWDVSGGGLREWFRDAVVEPYRGIRKDSQDSRVFSFAAERGEWYKAPAWKTPVVVQPYNMDPNDGPFGTAPAEWPDVPKAKWVWGVANNAVQNPAPEGVNYFRYEFSIPENVGKKSYSVFASAKDDFDIYIDGQVVIESRETAASAKTWRADFELGTGDHILAARVKANGGAHAGLIAALFRAGNAATSTPAMLLTYTGVESTAQLASQLVAAQSAVTAAQNYYNSLGPGPAKDSALYALGDRKVDRDRIAGLREWSAYQDTKDVLPWKVNPYPDPAPGWTPGEIMLTLLREAKARGVRFPGFLNPSFTASKDSNGADWGRPLDWSFRLGTEYIDVIERLEELVCDLWIDPETLALHMYADRGARRDTQSRAVQPVKFEIGRNVTRATEGGTSDIKNALLMSTADGWTALADGMTNSLSKFGRVEGFVSTGASASVSGDIAQRVFEQRASPKTSSTYNIIDVDDARPFTDYFVGDWVLAPSADSSSTLVPRRIMSISVEEDSDTGKPVYAVEFDTILQDRAARYDRWLKSTGDGTLGGTLANVSTGGGGGGGSPTTQNTQTGPVGSQGPTGPPGAGINWRGVWNTALQYAINDAVRFDKKVWVAKADSGGQTPATGSIYWELFLDSATDGRAVEMRATDTALQWRYTGDSNWITLVLLADLKGQDGADGSNGAGLTFRGAWSSTESYSPNDLVSYQNSLWITATANTSTIPGTSGVWQSAGTTGGEKRTVATYTTSSLAAGTQETGLVQLAPGYRIYRVQLSKQGRVRLYDTLLHRGSDLSRPKGTPIDEEADHGLMLDVALPSTVLTRTLSPVVDGVSFEAGNGVPITVSNLDTTAGTIKVTLTYVKAES